MDLYVLLISTLLIAFLAGAIGSFLGLGGGFIIVPALTLILGVPIHFAIGASFIGVLVNSTSSSVVYLREGLTNIRLGALLEVGGLIGAIVGATLALSLGSNTLSVIFGVALLFSAFVMIRRSKAPPVGDPVIRKNISKVPSSYLDRSRNSTVYYEPHHLERGIGLSVIGGLFAGLLGVGGGSVLVPILVRVMGVPIKVAIATSSYIIGITASAGALVFLSKGAIDVVIAVPTVLGVVFGAQLGSRAVRYARGDAMRTIFVIAVVYISLQMIASGIGFGLPL